ncbi:phage tail assembly protein [Vibrio sp.]|uniref:phage tail assembly protein n=1 Tax=Vibrio sp. TaxID=678 RepID=UPI003AA90AED
MAIMTFELTHGYKAGETTHLEVGLRELTPKDVFDAQMAAEKVGIVNDRPYAYTSDAHMGMELLARQVEYIGEIKGPLSVKELLKLETEDFALIQSKASELDQLLLPQEIMEGVEERGRS